MNFYELLIKILKKIEFNRRRFSRDFPKFFKLLSVK